jgi:3-hydroxybutyryl-CoA dehydrogenase
LVIEAIPEKLDLKRETFAAVDRAAPAHAILATNTSSLSVAAIAAATQRPGRVVGMHFFNPVHLMKLVEIVRHARSLPEAIALAVALAERFGKAPITVADSPGFASSRLGIAEYLAAALGPAFSAPSILRAKVAEGRLGRKSGEGFYRWSPDGKRLE